MHVFTDFAALPRIDVQLQPQGMVPLSTTSTGVASTLALSQQSRFSRSHVLFALAMLAASGAGTVLLLKVFKTNFLPPGC